MVREWDCYDSEEDDEGGYDDIEDLLLEDDDIPVSCSLCQCELEGREELMLHLLSLAHNRRLHSVMKAEKSSDRRPPRRKSLKGKGAILTKKLKIIAKKRALGEIDDEELPDDSDDEEMMELDASPVKDLLAIPPAKELLPSLVNKGSKKDSNKAVVPALPKDPLDLRNKINEMKDKQNEERKAEKRKKKNIRTREAKKRNKMKAKEEKLRIDQALEQLEEEDESVAFMKNTMGFSKFQTTKRSYF